MPFKFNTTIAASIARHRSQLYKTAGAIAGSLSIAALNIPFVQAAVPNSTTFNLFLANKNLLACVAADGKTEPTVKVTVTRGALNDQMTITTSGLKSGLQMDLFTVQNSILKADKTPISNFPGFGLAWYQTDLKGNSTTTIRTILLDQIFGFVQRNPQSNSPLQPTRTFHVGAWINNGLDVIKCTNNQEVVTPFNGELHAGPLAFISIPDAKTGLGPLCVNPNTSTSPATCNP